MFILAQTAMPVDVGAILKPVIPLFLVVVGVAILAALIRNSRLFFRRLAKGVIGGSVDGDAFRCKSDAEIIGERGERMLLEVLRGDLDVNRHRLVSDIYLPLDDGTTTQIDLIDVSEFGIFVIEMKNYKGWIFGNVKDKVWTQSLLIGHGCSEKNTFQNPVRQNYKHICTLSECLGIPKEYFHSIVAFGPESKLKGRISEAADVMCVDSVPAHIATFTRPIIKFQQLDEVVAVILEWQASIPPEIKAAHIDNLKSKFGKGR